MPRGEELDEVDQYVLEMNQITASLRALRERGRRIWNRAGSGRPPLAPDQIRKMREALNHLQIAART